MCFVTSKTLSAVSNLESGSLSVVSIVLLFPIRIEHGLRALVARLQCGLYSFMLLPSNSLHYP